MTDNQVAIPAFKQRGKEAEVRFSGRLAQLPPKSLADPPRIVAEVRFSGRLAQLVRAHPLQGWGQRFESSSAQIKQEIMFTVYVLKSLKNQKRYVGFTAQPLSKRLNWHRWGQ